MIFKQLLQANALQFLQIDSCRLGSVNENLSVILMAKKFGSKGAAEAAGWTSTPPAFGRLWFLLGLCDSIVCHFDYFFLISA